MQNFSKNPKAKVYNPFEEPSQIVKAAGEQVSGARVEPDVQTQAPLPGKDVTVPEEIIEAKSRARLRELREEISQVTEEREKQEALGKEEEELVERRQEGTARVGPPPEPQGKRPRGMLAGFAGFLKRKQGQTELGKNPAQ